MKLAFLGRCLAVRINFGQSLIARIGYHTGFSRYRATAIFEQLKIMLITITKVRRQNLLRLKIDN